jgi:DNA-directed RNA polymerase specialized sigma24 family protein
MDDAQPDNGLQGFDDLIDEIRSRLLPALVAKWGIEVGSDICSEVEEYAWANHERVLRMENPLGYLYRVAQSRSRPYTRWLRRSTFPSRFPDLAHHDPVLHDLLQHLAGLKPDQRVSVLLVHAFGWTYTEVAELLGVTRSVVNHHVHRGLAQLRRPEAVDLLLERHRHEAPTEETR